MLVRLRSALCALAVVALFTPALSFPAKAQDFVDDGSAGRELWRYAPGQAASCAFTVTTTSDSGAGSLRQAILDANASAGAETICFDIPGTGPHTIQPTSALPQITDPVTIDGLTQPGAACDSWPATLQVPGTGPHIYAPLLARRARPRLAPTDSELAPQEAALRSGGSSSTASREMVLACSARTTTRLPATMWAPT